MITGVRARILQVAPSEEIVMPFALRRRPAMALVEVECDPGLVGYGESWINRPSWAAVERRATIAEGVAPLLLGEDPGPVEALHAKLSDALAPLGRQWGAPGPISQAVSGADIALWDLAGRAAGAGVADLLGGRVRDKVAVYASSLGGTGVAEQARRWRDMGFGTMKLQVGFGRSVDVINLGEARQAVGDAVHLAVDANQRWTLHEALSMAGPLADAGVVWVEEPIAGNDLTELEEFHTRTGLAVATGENLYGLPEFVRYASSPAVAVLQPDVTKAGGVTALVAICRAVEEAGTAVVPHFYGGAIGYAATLQIAACCPVVELVEYNARSNPLRDPLLLDPPRRDGNFVTLPTGPGLGVELDARRVAEYEQAP